MPGRPASPFCPGAPATPGVPGRPSLESPGTPELPLKPRSPLPPFCPGYLRDHRRRSCYSRIRRRIRIHLPRQAIVSLGALCAVAGQTESPFCPSGPGGPWCPMGPTGPGEPSRPPIPFSPFCPGVLRRQDDRACQCRPSVQCSLGDQAVHQLHSSPGVRGVQCSHGGPLGLASREFHCRRRGSLGAGQARLTLGSRTSSLSLLASTTGQTIQASLSAISLLSGGSWGSEVTLATLK